VSASWPRAEPLTTQRLVLEPLRVEHAQEMAAVLCYPALHAFIGGTPSTEEQLSARYERQAAGQSPDGREGWLNWIVRDRETSAAVGTLQATISDTDQGRSAELAWVIATSRQGQGLATEAAVAGRDWLRERGVEFFSAHIHPEHAASATVAHRLGLEATDRRQDGEVRWVSISRARPARRASRGA
jgi:RimJ/RimL family protein N-acetyltransferase